MIDCPGNATGPSTTAASSPGTPALNPKDALDQVPLPDAVLQFQPAGNRTLVNFKSDFWVEANAFPAQVKLLGRTVDLKLRPVGFDWTFGDGTTLHTTIPGQPVGGAADEQDPDWNVRVWHDYTKTGQASATVTVTWGADYSVDGGAWAPVDGTVTKGSSPQQITIVEATPVLTD